MTVLVWVCVLLCAFMAVDGRQPKAFRYSAMGALILLAIAMVATWMTQ